MPSTTHGGYMKLSSHFLLTPRAKMHLLFLVIYLSHFSFSPATTIDNTLPGCPSKCGNLTVPYPFGIGTNSGCSIGPWFDITCDTSFNPPKAFLPADLYSYIGSNFHQLEVFDISDEHVRVKNTIASKCYNRTGHVIHSSNASGIVLVGSYFTFSGLNKLIAIGCDEFVNLSPVAGIDDNKFSRGCVTVCSKVEDVLVGSCSGTGCCTTGLPNGLTTYLINVFTFNYHQDIWSFDKCGYSFIGEQSEFIFNGASDLIDPDFANRMAETVPVVLDWVIGNRSCNEYKNTRDYYCQENSICVDSKSGNGGYRCYCKNGYEGNPYLSPGCHEIDECADPNKNPCNNACTKFPGGYNCLCPRGYKRNRRNTSEYYCQENSVCVDFENENGGYRCSCKKGYEGNPYLSPGCHDIDECADLNKNPCNGTCKNLSGSFKCLCPHGYEGDGRSCVATNSKSRALKLSLGMGFGFLSILIGMGWLYFSHQRGKAIKLKEKFFLKNGGMLLKQQTVSNEGGGVNQSTKLFTIGELKRATKNFSKDRILGRGGYGTVYKGILPDGNIVAIKRSRVLDESQIEQFINEVVILTQINHRNVVKLLGCCLESEVPLLVYECVSNGTLFDYIHTNHGMAWLSWDERLRIAVEAAGTLAYLHSAASKPIIHRDVKSANILLDDNLVSKISDFGASKLIPLDLTLVTTLVQGTLGYLDPEYFHTSQLTIKSDVYSFGVVLLELLTSKKPLCMERSQLERNLATYFLNSLKTNSLYKVIDPRVVIEGSLEQLNIMAALVKRCLSINGYDRPTMKEVAMELEGLRNIRKQTLVNQHQTEAGSLRQLNEGEP